MRKKIQSVIIKYALSLIIKVYYYKDYDALQKTGVEDIIYDEKHKEYNIVVAERSMKK